MAFAVITVDALIIVMLVGIGVVRWTVGENELWRLGMEYGGGLAFAIPGVLGSVTLLLTVVDLARFRVDAGWRGIAIRTFLLTMFLGPIGPLSYWVSALSDSNSD